MFLKRLVVGPLESNCYLVADEETKEGIIVDPGEEGERVLKAMRQEGIVPRYLINTHGHIDHIGANGYLKERIEGIKLGIHEADARMLINATDNLSNFSGTGLTSPPADFFLKEGDEIKAGGICLKIIHTPGHTLGGICLLGEGEIFTGDTLFAGSVGRTDLPGGSREQLMQSLKEKLMVLPEETVVHPGHGEPSTIGREKTTNPFL
ncbi:MAG: MBL fold metallo-hydrolase [Nitrospirae bacterium]|nr:MBL fold metallo-hydrolase [Nitrospirota bacterium]